MAPHANYGAVMVLRQEILQDMINISYHAGKIPKNFPVDMPGISARFFLDIPRIEFSKSISPFIFIDIKFWGPMTINAFNTVLTVSAMFSIRERIVLRVGLKGEDMTFSLDPGRAFMDSVNCKVYSGQHTSEAQTLINVMLNDSAARDNIQNAVISALNKQEEGMLPTINIGFLGGFINETNAAVTAKPLDGLLALGLDMKINGYWTFGNPSELADITDGFEAGYWINPDAIELLLGDSRQEIAERVQEAEAVLNYLNISLQEGSIHVEGKATKSPGVVRFSMDFVPNLIRYGVHVEWDDDCDGHVSYTTPSREELWFEARNIEVDLEVDWWVRVLQALGGAFSFGIIALSLQSLFQMYRGNIFSGIQNSGTMTMGNRVQEFTLPGMSEPTIRMKLENFLCHTNGIHVLISIKPQFPSSKITVDGPTFIPIEDLEKASIKYRVKFPYGISVEDPELRIRWTVRRISDNNILLSSDENAASNMMLQLDDIKQEFYNTSNFMIECRIYRTMGADITDYYNSSVILKIFDRLDRSKPYVRWSHYVWVPVIRVEQDGSHTHLGYELQYRISDIHRTDYPGRCLMASRYSVSMPYIEPTHKEIVLDRLKPTELTYMDELPFPEEDLIQNRHQVCDYCFFGGPDKDTPIKR